MIVTLGDLVVATTPAMVHGVKLKLTNLRGWYAGAPVRTVVVDMPESDGAFEPDRSYRGSKQMAIEGWVQARSVEEAEENGHDLVAGIAPLGEALTLKVESSSGLVRYMNVRISGVPDVQPYTDRRARFQIPLIAADSRKYAAWTDPQSALPSGGSGDGMTFPVVGPLGATLDFGTFSPTGLITLRNSGTAPSWPVFHVFGGIDASGFEIISGDDVIRFTGAVPLGAELVLDPYAGGRAVLSGVDVTGASLTRSEWQAVMPRSTRTFSFDPLGSADATARLEAHFREAWW